MNITEQKKKAKEFIKRWENRGNERQDSQSFWLDLLQSVYGVENPTEYITFEDKVKMDHTSFIDGFIDTTKVLIEQKGADKDLNQAIRQSDNTLLTPVSYTHLDVYKRQGVIFVCNTLEQKFITCYEANDILMEGNKVTIHEYNVDSFKEEVGNLARKYYLKDTKMCIRDRRRSPHGTSLCLVE